MSTPTLNTSATLTSYRRTLLALLEHLGEAYAPIAQDFHEELKRIPEFAFSDAWLDSPFRDCSTCGKTDAVLSIGKSEYAVCYTHKQAFCIGYGIIGVYDDETPEQEFLNKLLLYLFAEARQGE